MCKIKNFFGPVDDDISELSTPCTLESDSTHSSGSNQSVSRMGQSSTNGIRHSQHARKPVIYFWTRQQLNMTNFIVNLLQFAKFW